jgi:hypothetical protein
MSKTQFIVKKKGVNTHEMSSNTINMCKFKLKRVSISDTWGAHSGVPVGLFPLTCNATSLYKHFSTFRRTVVASFWKQNDPRSLRSKRLHISSLLWFAIDLKEPVPVAARLLRSWVRIPPEAWMSLCCECYICSQVEVSAASWSLVQRSPTDCGASCVIKKLREWGGHSPRWAAEPCEKKIRRACDNGFESNRYEQSLNIHSLRLFRKLMSWLLNINWNQQDH